MHEGGFSISFKARNIGDKFFGTFRNRLHIRVLNVVLFFHLSKNYMVIFISLQQQ